MEDKVKLLVSSSDYVEKQGDRYFFNDLEVDGNDDTKKNQNRVSEIVNNFTNKPFDNFIVLTGAGSSMLSKAVIGQLAEGNNQRFSGVSMWELTNEIDSDLKAKNLIGLDKLISMCKYSYKKDDQKFNIEDFLSQFEKAEEFLSKKQKEEHASAKECIYKKIRALCDLNLSKEHPHAEFLNKILSQKKSSRLRIYTTNYDTLFEQALQKIGSVTIDGFSFTFPSKFNDSFFDYDLIIRKENKLVGEHEFVDKVAYLMKLHGSVEWFEKDGEVYKKSLDSETDHSLMIYPRRNKFEQSYEVPFFDLFSRFQIDLRRKNTLLIVIGFSFGDKHIKTIVKNALINNQSLSLLIVSPRIETEEYADFLDDAKKYNNVMLYSSTFNNFASIYKKPLAFSDDLFNGGSNA